MYTNDPLARAMAIHVITRSNPARRVHQPTGRAASRSTRPYRRPVAAEAAR